MEINFDNYKHQVLQKLVRIDKFYNPAALGLSDKDAREKGLWHNKEKLPTLKQLQKAFEEMKEGFEIERNAVEKKDEIQKDNTLLKKDLDTLIYTLLEKEQDLGLTAKELATFNLLRGYSVQEAIVFLQEKSSLTKEKDNVRGEENKQESV